MKKLLFLLLFLPLIVRGQLNVRAKAFVSSAADETTVKGLQAQDTVNQAYFYYNLTSKRWMIYDSLVWKNMVGGGGSGGSFWPLNGAASFTAPVSIQTGTNDLLIQYDSANAGGAGYFYLSGTGSGAGQLGLYSFNGQITSAEFSALSGTSGQFTLNDLRASPKGLQYSGDYTATLTTRSLTDVGYTNNHYVQGNSTTQNFLMATSSAAPWTVSDGGLSRSTSTLRWQNGAASSFAISGTNDLVFSPTQALSGTLASVQLTDGGTTVQPFSIQGAPANATNTTGGSLTLRGGSGYTVGATTGGNLILSSGVPNSTGAAGNVQILSGGGTFAGATYAADYSANFGVRSIVDKGYTLGAKTFNGTQTLSTGSTSAAPLTFVAGTNTTVIANGNMEYDGTNLTFASGGTRHIMNAEALTIAVGWGGANFTDATNYFDAYTYSGSLVTALATSSGVVGTMYIPKTGIITVADINWFATTAGSNEAVTIALRVNNTTDTNIATISTSNALKNFRNTALSISVNAGDTVEIKIICPTWAVNPLIASGTGYIMLTY